VPTYPFLSDEWITEARTIRAEMAAQPDLEAPVAPGSVRMNQVITEVPFGDGRLDAHLDYSTAKSIFVDGTLEAGMKAFMDGKVRVTGDMAKLISALQQLAPPDPGAIDQAQARIREITE